MIISIPGARLETYKDSDMDCFCAACVETLEFNKRNQDTDVQKDLECSPRADKSTEEDLLRIYSYFDTAAFPKERGIRSNDTPKSLKRYIPYMCSMRCDRCDNEPLSNYYLPSLPS